MRYVKTSFLNINVCVYVTSLYLCIFHLFKRKIKWLQPGSKSKVGGTALGAGLSDYRVLRSWHQWNLWAGNQLNARNEKCPDYGPDASPRKAVADYHALVAGEHVLTTATGVGALEVSSGVVFEVPLEGTCRRVEVEAEITSRVSPNWWRSVSRRSRRSYRRKSRDRRTQNSRAADERSVAS